MTAAEDAMLRGRRRSPLTRPAASGRVPLRRAFATRALQQCQLAVAASRLVETAVLVTVSVALFERGGAAAVALYGVVTTLGPALGTPVVVAAAGRRSPGAALAACLGGGAASLAVATWAVAGTGPVAVVLVAVGAGAVLLTSVRPIVTSLLPSYIRSPGELSATNAAAAGVETVSVILGPMLAAAGLALADPATVLAWAAGLLAVSAGATASLDGTARTLEPTTHLAADVVGGLRSLARRGPVRLVTVLVGSQTFVRGALNVIVVSLAFERLGLGDSGVGVLLGAIGIGGLLGLPIAAGAAGTGRHGRNLVAGLALWGVPLAALGTTTTDPVVLALLAVAGLGNTVVDISTDSLLQRLAPRGQLAALLGSFEAVLFLPRAAGATVAGLLLAVVDPGTAILLVGAIPVAVVLVGAVPGARLDGGLRERDAGVALLQTNGVFSPLVLSAVDQLSRAAAVERFEPGERILTEGAVGDRYYVIASGVVDVVRGGRVVDEMGAGDGFGEVALLDGAPRNATIVARTPVTAHTLDGESFLAALGANTTSRTAAERIAEARRHDRSRPTRGPDRPHGQG